MVEHALPQPDSEPNLGADAVTPEWDLHVQPGAWSQLRVLIVHDWITTWAGSERCVEQILTLFPQVDFVVGVLAPAMGNFNAVTRRAHETWLARLPGARSHHRWFLPLEAAAFASLDTRPYDLVLSSAHALCKLVRSRPGAPHICYCYSPPRYLWDLGATYRQLAPPLQRLALVSATMPLRELDRRGARRVDYFLAISRHVADRVRRCYGRTADVVYPPVEAKPVSTQPSARGDFLLSLGRLVSYKRVDLAILAAERLGKRLIVAGDGPERRRWQAMAGRHTEFVGEVSETQAGDLLSSCAAFVFCAEEDFGIAPLEANAHGAPVVGFARGGLLETMREHESAEFFHEQSPGAVANAILRASDREWDAVALRSNAARFSPIRFRHAFAGAIARVLSRDDHLRRFSATEGP